MSIFIKSLVPIEENSKKLDELSLRLHYIFPNAESPYNISKVVKDINDTEIKLPIIKNKAYDGIVYCCLHVLKNGKVYGKETLPCHFSLTNTTSTFDPLTFSFPNQNEITKSFILMHNTNHSGIMVTDTRMLQTARNMLLSSISNVMRSIEDETKQILSMEHLDSRTSRLHSVQYHVSSTPVIYLPFFSLTMRGKDLFKNVAVAELGTWKTLFNREFLFQPPIMKNFMQQSFKAYRELQKNGSGLVALSRGVYNYISTIFSHLIQKFITYKRDIEATIYKDYIGITRPNNSTVFADCEDIAQMGHDTMRIFRKLYPDVSINNQTTHLGHISYWLKMCDFFIVQGAVGDARAPTLQSHVWTMFSPTKILNLTHQDVGSFIVEGTGEASPGQYRYLHHVWHFDSALNKATNAMMMTEEGGKKKIGIRMHETLTKNLPWFLENRSIQFQDNVNISDVHAVLSLNPQEYHPLRLMNDLHMNPSCGN